MASNSQNAEKTRPTSCIAQNLGHVIRAPVNMMADIQVNKIGIITDKNLSSFLKTFIKSSWVFTLSSRPDRISKNKTVTKDTNATQMIAAFKIISSVNINIFFFKIICTWLNGIINNKIFQ